jgi:hypothetical protein
VADIEDMTIPESEVVEAEELLGLGVLAFINGSRYT